MTTASLNSPLALTVSILSIIVAFGPPALAFTDRYLPFPKSEARQSFPVRYLGELGPEHLISTLPVGPSGMTVSAYHTPDLLLSGNDKLSKKWMIAISGGGIGPYAAYASDLDHDGTPDLILLCGTGGCGLAPSTHLLCFLFDANGRPVPFTAEGDFECDKHGIRDLVDFDGDGKAELVFMSFDDGYWITNLYQARGGRWQEVQGALGTRTYPIYTRFTNSENHTPVTPKAGRHPFAPDLSNAHATVEGRLLSYRWANVEQSEDIQLNLKTQRGDRVPCKPVSWYSTFSIVLDEPNGRQIVSLAADPKSVRALLDKIVAAGYEVTLFGQRRPNSRTPELLWATPKSKPTQGSKQK
jgi:hypothetical protein